MMMDHRHTQPCPRDDCDVERYSQIAIDIHIVQDHGLRVSIEDAS